MSINTVNRVNTGVMVRPTAHLNYLYGSYN
jgi:hypothetical protein